MPIKDNEKIRESVINKSKSELNLRISKGYENIDLSLVEKFVDELLKDLNLC